MRGLAPVVFVALSSAACVSVPEPEASEPALAPERPLGRFEATHWPDDDVWFETLVLYPTGAFRRVTAEGVEQAGRYGFVDEPGQILMPLYPVPRRFIEFRDDVGQPMDRYAYEYGQAPLMGLGRPELGSTPESQVSLWDDMSRLEPWSAGRWALLQSRRGAAPFDLVELRDDLGFHVVVGGRSLEGVFDEECEPGAFDFPGSSQPRWTITMRTGDGGAVRRFGMIMSRRQVPFGNDPRRLSLVELDGAHDPSRTESWDDYAPLPAAGDAP
jgi:hypothetical protein